ncbi:MAG: carbohydrate kinase [Sphingobacteriales bacterium]|nr:MAG: carbohydrate kinase [Sphingobacteriales bacterium]
MPVIAIFDVGKTNKKLLLFNEQYKLVFEESKQFAEIKDEDDFPCEDVIVLTDWIKESFEKVVHDERFEVKGVNFSGYGASFVYVDKGGKVISPLYNYLKSYPPELQKKFYDDYGGESAVAKQTASPVLGNLNSGMQLYLIKYKKPELYKNIAFAFHLPQYLSYILTDYPATDITSVGCHTNLWNFNEQKYHHWVLEEGIINCFAPVLPCSTYVPFIFKNKNYIAGIGLHDSSAALIPYLISFSEPFILLSTGTWCITLNPFNHTQLTDYELHQDCLCFLSYKGKPVKASRLFAGYEHEQQTKRLATYFNKPGDYYKSVLYNASLVDNYRTKTKISPGDEQSAMVGQSAFSKRELSSFKTYEDAYHQLIADIIEQQIHSSNIVLKGTNVKRIFVDGGFSKNQIYMQLLADAFPGIEVYAATIPQASALGAALCIHDHWNSKDLPGSIIELKYYTPEQKLIQH